MGNQYGKEKRKTPRLPFREDIVVDGAKLCTSNDISEGGLFVSAIQIFEVDEVIEVTIPFEQEKMIVKAKVKYCQPGIGMGIMFIDLNDEQKEKIRKLVTNVSGKNE